MNNINNITSWNERFALIDRFRPSVSTICKVFNVTEQEYNTAEKLKIAGTFQASSNIDVNLYEDLFKHNVSDSSSSVSTSLGTEQPNSSVTSHAAPETATKKTVIKTPQKRGRKGNKIIQALKSVTTTPVPVSSFIAEHKISLAVLRQSKRFIETLPTEEQHQFTKINVKQDKTTKELMIWCDELQEQK